MDNPININPTDINPEAENEVIRESVSHKLYRPLVSSWPLSSIDAYASIEDGLRPTGNFLSFM